MIPGVDILIQEWGTQVKHMTLELFLDEVLVIRSWEWGWRWLIENAAQIFTPIPLRMFLAPLLTLLKCVYFEPYQSYEQISVLI